MKKKSNGLIDLYINQGTSYKRLLSKTNDHGKHNKKISSIDKKITRAKHSLDA